MNLSNGFEAKNRIIDFLCEQGWDKEIPTLNHERTIQLTDHTSCYVFSTHRHQLGVYTDGQVAIQAEKIDGVIRWNGSFLD